MFTLSRSSGSKSTHHHNVARSSLSSPHPDQHQNASSLNINNFRIFIPIRHLIKIKTKKVTLSKNKMKSEAKIKAHKSDDSVSNPRKRARKTTSANQYDNDDDGDSGPGTTVMTFNNEQKDRLYSLHINKEKLRDIHNFFIKEYDFEGTIKSLEGCIYKLKAERTMLSEEDVSYSLIDRLR